MTAWNGPNALGGDNLIRRDDTADRGPLARRYLDQNMRLCRVLGLHFPAQFEATGDMVCLHCSQLAGRSVAFPCPTMQVFNDPDAAVQFMQERDDYWYSLASPEAAAAAREQLSELEAT